jgi:hypothetical protein
MPARRRAHSLIRSIHMNNNQIMLPGRLNQYSSQRLDGRSQRVVLQYFSEQTLSHGS